MKPFVINIQGELRPPPSRAAQRSDGQTLLDWFSSHATTRLMCSKCHYSWERATLSSGAPLIDGKAPWSRYDVEVVLVERQRAECQIDTIYALSWVLCYIVAVWYLVHRWLCEVWKHVLYRWSNKQGYVPQKDQGLVVIWFISMIPLTNKPLTLSRLDIQSGTYPHTEKAA